MVIASRVQRKLAPSNGCIWIDNSVVGSDWQLTEKHILTGVPQNHWRLRLPPGVCLDFSPVDSDRICVRFYGFDDSFRGALRHPNTQWLSRSAASWFHAHGIDWYAAGLDPATDIYDACLFPILNPDDIDTGFLQWLIAENGVPAPEFRQQWLSATRASARKLLHDTNLKALAAQRRTSQRDTVALHIATSWIAACSRLDLAATAELFEREKWPLPPENTLSHSHSRNSVALAHDRMFRAAVARCRGNKTSAQLEGQAFESLRRIIVTQVEGAPVQPARNVPEDQIVWGRSPVRLDLAGGRTDTPPYCLENGGRVVNVAVDLNGQPPIQVYVRIAEEPIVILRSVDLGVDERITSYDELRAYGQLGSSFGIARAALALAGLEPRFHAGHQYGTLREQLHRELGGGIELTMLAAVPKGSGLGTSSILAATILGTLSELLGLHWTQNDLFTRTLALEQMLTSGGGWQDQVGGMTAEIKLIETFPGLDQTPVIRWLPNQFFDAGHADRDVLLYYTGLTRVAHDILAEIVRGLFLNSQVHLNLIDDIGRNALFAADAIQRNDWSGLCEAVRRIWDLNQRLDSGTNPPEVQAIIAAISDYISACKLPGAGGGGYLLIFAKDPDAGNLLRQKLVQHPPNARARFVKLGLSTAGFKVTRS